MWFLAFHKALLDSAAMLPFLAGIYMLVEWVEYRLGEGLQDRIREAKGAGPLLGAIFGCVPQCGFSVMSSALYAKGFITRGTLLAVFLSTSDEALPVILSQPGKLHLVLPILSTKVVVALVAGLLVDLVWGRRLRATAPEADQAQEVDHSACCGHNVPCERDLEQLLLHPLWHTAKVFIFIFLANFALNAVIGYVGEANLSRVLLQHTPWQPIIATFIGLVPNCAASVAIAEVFLKGGLSFGATIAGLCASAGLGILVLFRENPSRKDTFLVLGLLVGVSIAVGLVIQGIYG